MLLPVGTAAVTTVGVDIVEVLRGTTAGPRLVAAGVAGGMAAAAVLITVAVWSIAGRRRRAGAVRAVQVTGVVALLATGAEVALLLSDGATLGDRWLTVALARVLLLLVFLERSASRLVRDLLAVALLLTALFGAPLASGAAAPGTVLLVAAASLGVTMLVVGRVGSSSGDREPTIAAGDESQPEAAVGRRTVLASLAALAATAAVLGPLSAPDPVPPHHQERQVVDGLAFDLTIAPARPGPNEAHLYAFDTTGRPAAVTEVSIAVEGVASTAHELFEVSPDHHLSYALELPDAQRWQVVFQATGEDGQGRELRLDIDG